MAGWRGRRDGAEDEVLRLLRQHAGELLRFARRFSLCADDAQDAYQRSVEIFLRRMRTDPPEKPVRWLQTVLRHEALAVREQRLQEVGRDELDLDAASGGARDDPADRAERFERLEHAAEALRRLKPQEVTALVLRAEGFSYEEICDRTGWSYTRCNRAVTEGRRALVARMRAIESGAECERWVPLLSMLADGEASARDLADLRPHLRGCRACRATLRSFHEAPRQIGALLPAELLPVAAAGVAGGGQSFGIGRQLEALAQLLSERATAGAMRMQGALDALPATKVAAVAASTAALAGGGAAIERVAADGGPPGGDAPPARVIASESVAGGARPILAAGPAAPPIVRLPPGRTASAGARDPRPAGPVAVPSATADEFGFEAAGGDPDRERRARDRRRRDAAAAAAASAARSKPAAPQPAAAPPRPAPAEFHAPPPAAPSATAAAAPSTPAPPEFAGP